MRDELCFCRAADVIKEAARVAVIFFIRKPPGVKFAYGITLGGSSCEVLLRKSSVTRELPEQAQPTPRLNWCQ